MRDFLSNKSKTKKNQNPSGQLKKYQKMINFTKCLSKFHSFYQRIS